VAVHQMGRGARGDQAAQFARWPPPRTIGYHTGFPSLSRVIQALLFVALCSAQNAGAAGCSQRGSRRSRLEISGCRPLLAARRCQSVALQRTQGAGEVRANYLDVRPVIAGDNAVVFATLI